MKRAFWIAIPFSCILGATRANTMGDAPSYVDDIVNHLGKSPFGHSNSLWEFGHLLWRPLGWVLTSLLSPAISAITDWTPFMQASFILITISVLSSMATIVLWYLLLIDVTRSRVAAVLVALAMSCSHGFLLYSHSGCSYIPGLMCLTASLYLLRKGHLASGAVCYALTALIWLPFILAGAALLLVAAYPRNWELPLGEGLRQFIPSRAIRFVAITGACVIVVFGLAIAATRISSLQEAKNWYAGSRHGLSQNIRGVRIATGLPRAFLSLGKDGVLYKRYLKHDPYAPVTARDLVGASLWKIVAFYLFLVCLFFELIRRTQSGFALLLLLAGVCPVILFAVFLFEPSMPERYLPAFPFLVVAVGWILHDLPRTRRAAQFIVVGFLVCVVINNIYSFAAPRIANQDERSWERLADFRGRLTHADVAAVLTDQDEILDLINRSPFAAVNRPEPIRIYDVIEPATLRVLHWRKEFAGEALKIWEQGGQVWVSKRVWSERPRPEWEWVEGDDPRITWPELPKFFTPLQTDTESGGADGFSRLARNSVNENYLVRFATENYRQPKNAEITAE